MDDVLVERARDRRVQRLSGAEVDVFEPGLVVAEANGVRFVFALPREAQDPEPALGETLIDLAERRVPSDGGTEAYADHR